MTNATELKAQIEAHIQRMRELHGVEYVAGYLGAVVSLLVRENMSDDLAHDLKVFFNNG